MRRLFPRGYGFTVLGIAVGMAGLVALGAMAERISRFIEGRLRLRINWTKGQATRLSGCPKR